MNALRIALFALALRSGQFYIPEERTTRTFNVQAPIRIRVRAIVKTAVPMFWPKDEADGWAEFDEMKLNSVADAFRSKAEQIRGARRAGVIPWQLMGRQCTEFNRRCEVWDVCEAGKWPVYELGFDADDPAASLAVQFLPAEAKDPDAVILSSSAYQTYGKCMELGRQQSMGGGKEENLALQTGTVLHAGAAEMFRQVREQQQK